MNQSGDESFLSSPHFICGEMKRNPLFSGPNKTVSVPLAAIHISSRNSSKSIVRSFPQMATPILPARG